MATGSSGTNDDGLVNKAMMAINFNNYSIEDDISLEENDRGLVTPYIAYRNRNSIKQALFIWLHTLLFQI